MASAFNPSLQEWAGASKTTLALAITDIVGSTALRNELGNERMSKVRRAHFKRARHLIEKYEGYEIKTIGDSFMVAFRTAVEAVNFALFLYAKTGHERVKIRVGIHVGLVQIEEEDTFGTMVDYAARVKSQAKGTAIWVSDRAKEDVNQEKTRAHRMLRWTEQPDCELKGFDGKHRLWSVTAPEKKVERAQTQPDRLTR